MEGAKAKTLVAEKPETERFKVVLANLLAQISQKKLKFCESCEGSPGDVKNECISCNGWGVTHMDNSPLKEMEILRLGID